ncbi:MAG TPA: DUF2442 domain-containing protein [Caulobacteraceae bacterium]|nr:DUF2442 domain-containing protein [Caulobacteraceae bacterium]
MNATVATVEVSRDRLEVSLQDGRRASAPLSWFPKLAATTPEARRMWEPCAAGLGIHWPLIDEDLSVAGLLRSDRDAA